MEYNLDFTTTKHSQFGLHYHQTFAIWILLQLNIHNLKFTQPNIHNMNYSATQNELWHYLMNFMYVSLSMVNPNHLLDETWILSHTLKNVMDFNMGFGPKT